MKYSLIITDEDFINASVEHAIHSNAGKHTLKRYCIQRGALAAFAFIFGVYCYCTKQGMYTDIFAFVAIIALLQLSFTPMLYRRNIRRSILRMKKDGKLPFSEHVDLELLDQECIVTTARSVVHIIYDEVTSLDKLERWILLVSNGRMAIIPAHCFDDQSEYEMLYDMLKQKTNCYTALK